MNEETKNYIDQQIREHLHGGNAQSINLRSIFGLFETVSTVPTISPQTPFEQIKIYVNGATYRLYWYDGNANVWHYVTATA